MNKEPKFDTPTEEEFDRYKSMAIDIVKTFAEVGIGPRTAASALEIATAMTMLVLAENCKEDPIPYVDCFAINVRGYIETILRAKPKDEEG